MLEQGLTSYEVILVDDASPDGSSIICDNWAKCHPQFHVVHCVKNGGLSKARNVGLSWASGLFIAFLDSDDYLAPNTLQSAVALLQSQLDVDVVEFPVSVAHGSMWEKIYWPTTQEKPERINFAEWVETAGYQYAYAWNKVYRRKLWQISRFPAGRLFEDLLTIPYVLENARAILRIRVGMYYYMAHPDTISSRQDTHTLQELYYARLKLYLHLDKQKKLISSNALDACYLSLCNSAISYQASGGKPFALYRRVSLHSARNHGITCFFKALLNNLCGISYCTLYARLQRLKSCFF